MYFCNYQKLFSLKQNLFLHDGGEAPDQGIERGGRDDGEAHLGNTTKFQGIIQAEAEEQQPDSML